MADRMNADTSRVTRYALRIPSKEPEFVRRVEELSGEDVFACYQCGSTEYLVRRCPNRRNESKGTSRDMFCFVCGGRNHAARTGWPLRKEPKNE